MSASASKSGGSNYPSTVSQFERTLSSTRDVNSQGSTSFNPYESGSHWGLEHLKYFRVLAKVQNGPVSSLRANYARCEEAISHSPREKDLQSLSDIKDTVIRTKSPMELEISAGNTKFGPFMIAIGDAIRKDNRGLQQSIVHRGQHDQWPRDAKQASRNQPTASSPLSSEQVSSSPPKTSHSDDAYSDSRDSQSTGQQDESKAEPMSQYLANQFIQGTILEYMTPGSLFSGCHTSETNLSDAYLWYESWPHHFHVAAGTINSKVYDDGCFTVLIKPSGDPSLSTNIDIQQIKNQSWVCSVETKKGLLDPESVNFSTGDGDCQRLGQNIAEMWATIYRRIVTEGGRNLADDKIEAVIDNLSDANLRVFLVVFQHTYFQIATTQFTKQYLKSYLVPGYNADLRNEKYYLTVDFSYRRDVAKRTHRSDAIIMMASLVDYLYDIHIRNAPPTFLDTIEDQPNDYQASENDTSGSDGGSRRSEDETSDQQMEDDDDFTNDDRENYDENQMDEDYDLESYPRNQSGDLVDELSYIVPRAPTKRRKI
ncbi:hypothetical protein TWF506_000414 [Arthrobotrys conoides]|uniref:Uncharacterized protein n=1 Tax=Arthrobotrys conoides TaxID=74498 RepID=A0AAN8NQX1_9PEZI